jgi:hypothetical protein
VRLVLLSSHAPPRNTSTAQVKPHCEIAKQVPSAAAQGDARAQRGARRPLAASPEGPPRQRGARHQGHLFVNSQYAPL